MLEEQLHLLSLLLLIFLISSLLIIKTQSQSMKDKAFLMELYLVCHFPNFIHFKGLLLEMVLRLAYLSRYLKYNICSKARNPIHGEIAVTVIFGIITILCIAYSQYFSVKLRGNSNLKIEGEETYDNAYIEMQVLKKQGTGSGSGKSGSGDSSARSELNLGKIEYLWWFFVAFSIGIFIDCYLHLLASFIIVPLYTLVSSEIIPRYYFLYNRVEYEDGLEQNMDSLQQVE